MKTYFLLALLILLGSSLHSQTFQNSLSTASGVNIDITSTVSTPSNGYNPGASYSVNYKNRLHQYEAPYLHSLLMMYETTKHIKYLNTFIIHAKRVIDRRDDNLSINPNPTGGIDPVCIPVMSSLLAEGSSYCWSSVSATEPWSKDLINQGVITMPLAMFSYMIKVKYPQLKSLAVPTSAAGIDASGYYNIVNYGDFAELLKIKVNQTCYDFFGESPYWNDLLAAYHYYDPNSQTYNIASPNFIASIGRTEVYLYKIYEAESAVSTNNLVMRDYYLHKIRRISQRLVSSSIGFERSNNLVRWKYMGTNPENPVEDIAHALLVFEFGDLCNLFQIKDEFDVLLFSNDLMFDFANTFKEKFVKYPQKYWLSIDGDDTSQGQIIVGSDENNIQRLDQYMNAGRYIFMCRHMPDLYNMIADYFYEFSLYGQTSSKKYINQGGTGFQIAQSNAVDAISGLAFYRNGSTFTNYFDIKIVKRDTEYDVSSDFAKPSIFNPAVWSGVVTGKFDVDRPTTDLMVTIRYSNGAIEIREINSANKISNPIATYTTSGSHQWGGMAAGDIITGNGREEFILFNNSDKKFYLFKVEGNQIVNVGSYYTGKTWAGIAIGNFDNVVGDEIVALSKETLGLAFTIGKMYMYEYNGTGFDSKTITNNSLSQYIVVNPVGIAVGNLDKNTANGLEIITVNNNSGSDNNIKVFNLTGTTTFSFSPTIFQFIGTNGNYSQWKGIAVGDFNADGYDEFIVNRNYDGDFYMFYLDGGILKNLCKEHFPVNWRLGLISGIHLTNSNKDHILSLRNIDGNMFVFNPIGLPSIPGRIIYQEVPKLRSMNITNESNFNKDEQLKIYPNPFTSEFNVEFELGSVQKIQIYDALGKIIKEYKVAEDSDIFQIDLFDSPLGVYIVKINKGEEVLLRRIVKK